MSSMIFLPMLGIGDFTPPEHHGDLHLVVLLKKLPDMLDLDLQIMLLRLGSETDLLDLNDRLALFGDLNLLALLVSEFSIIHDPADRRRRGGRHFHQIQTRLGRLRQGIRQRNDPQLLPVHIDYPDRRSPDLTVDP